MKKVKQHKGKRLVREKLVDEKPSAMPEEANQNRDPDPPDSVLNEKQERPPNEGFDEWSVSWP